MDLSGSRDISVSNSGAGNNQSTRHSDRFKSIVSHVGSFVSLSEHGALYAATGVSNLGG